LDQQNENGTCQFIETPGLSVIQINRGDKFGIYYIDTTAAIPLNPDSLFIFKYNYLYASEGENWYVFDKAGKQLSKLNKIKFKPLLRAGDYFYGNYIFKNRKYGVKNAISGDTEMSDFYKKIEIMKNCPAIMAYCFGSWEIRDFDLKKGCDGRDFYELNYDEKNNYYLGKGYLDVWYVIHPPDKIQKLSEYKPKP
jgi:hypothetical protein